jgi:translation initiation factor IF-2
VRACATNVRPSSVLVSLALHVCALMALVTTTLLPQRPPVIEVFQADEPPVRPSSSVDEGTPSPAGPARPQLTASRVAAPAAKPASALSTTRGDAKEKPRALPPVESPLAALPKLEPARQEPLLESSPPPPPAAAAVAKPSTGSTIALAPRERAPASPSAPAPATPGARAPESPPVERPSLRPESIAPAAPHRRPKCRWRRRLRATTSSSRVLSPGGDAHSTGSFRPVVNAAADKRLQGRTTGRPPPSAQPPVTREHPRETAPSAVATGAVCPVTVVQPGAKSRPPQRATRRACRHPSARSLHRGRLH